MIDVVWNNWKQFYKRVIIKKWIHFHSSTKLQVNEEVFVTFAQTDTPSQTVLGQCVETCPQLSWCVNRGLAPLCLGLYHSMSQTEMVWVWSHQAEQIPSEGEDTERGWEEQCCLEGGRPKASLMFHRLGFGKEIFQVSREEGRGACRWEEGSQWSNRCIAIWR